MAHLPNMSALALDRAPLVATGARKTSGKNSAGGAASKKQKVDGSDAPATPSAKRTPEQEVAREASAKKAREERAEFKKKLDERIEELLRRKQIKNGEKGWVPHKRGSDGNFVDPNPDQSCCTTGGRLGDVLPEGLRRGEASPTPKRAPAAIQDPEAWALAQKEQAEAALLQRMAMSQEEWDAEWGGKRHAQIESIKKRLNGYERYRHHMPLGRRSEGGQCTTRPVTPNHNDRRYSKRGWAGAVRQWTEQVQSAWGGRPGDARWHRTPSRLKESE